MSELDLGSNETARPRRRRRLIAAGLAVVLTAGVGSYLVVRAHGNTSQADRTLIAQQSAQQDAARKKAAWKKADRSTCRRLDASYRTAVALTGALSADDEKAFMALAQTAQARRAMSRWWGNVHALGFTTGAALHHYPFNPPSPPPTSSRYEIAWHSSLDGSSPRPGGTELVPDAGATDYELTSSATWDGQRCVVSINKWNSLSHAPWDLPQQLYVKRTAHSFAAGEQSNQAAVDHAAQISETAYTWLHGFLKANGHEDYLQRSGVMTFVSTTGRQGLDWFSSGDQSSDGGWTNDPDQVLSTGPALSAIRPVMPLPEDGSTALSPISESGTNRVILLPAILRGQAKRDQLATMVFQLTQATFYNLTIQTYVPARPKVSTAGAGAFGEAVFRADPASYRGRPMPELLKEIRSHSSRFTGQLPVNKDFYGTGDLANYYYSVSATTYAYIASSSGMAVALQAIHDAHKYARTPLRSLITRTTGMKVTFADGAKLQRQWVTWLRKQL